MAHKKLSKPAVFNLMIWYRSVLSILFALVAFTILAYYGWWIAGAILAVIALFMAWWVSPLRKGQHQGLEEALAERKATKNAQAIIIWAPTSKLSSQLQTGILPTDPTYKWTNFFFDEAAQAFALKLAQEKHPEAGKAESYNLLPIAIFNDKVLTQATAGAVKDALK